MRARASSTPVETSTFFIKLGLLLFSHKLCLVLFRRLGLSFFGLKKQERKSLYTSSVSLSLKPGNLLSPSTIPPKFLFGPDSSLK